MRPIPLVQFNRVNQPTIVWTPTTFADLEGKFEQDLEEMIASNLNTLGINELARTDFKYQVLRQCQLPREFSSTIRPDLIVVREDGELFVIEVKVGTNTELFNRKAIGQVIEYASAISQLSESKIANMLDRDNMGLNLGELFDYWFITPEHKSHYRVQNSRQFLRNVEIGNINLLIVSDILPSGAYNWIDEWSTQSHLPFKFSAIEVKPFVNSHDESILLVPQTKIETVIISRSVVEVKQLDGQVTVNIQYPSIRHIEQNQKSIINKQAEPLSLGDLFDFIMQAAQIKLGGDISKKYKAKHDIQKRDDFEQIVFTSKLKHVAALRIYLSDEKPIGWLAWIEYGRETVDPNDRVPLMFEIFRKNSNHRYDLTFDTGANARYRGMGVSSSTSEAIAENASTLSSYFQEPIIDSHALRDELSEIYVQFIKAMIEVLDLC
jgi:hypothetical protein